MNDTKTTLVISTDNGDYIADVQEIEIEEDIVDDRVITQQEIIVESNTMFDAETGEEL